MVILVGNEWGERHRKGRRATLVGLFAGSEVRVGAETVRGRTGIDNERVDGALHRPFLRRN